MDWRAWLTDSPLRISGAVAVVVVCILAVGAASAGVLLADLGCTPVAYGPQADFSFSETVTESGAEVTVTMAEGDRVNASHLFVQADALNRSWASLADSGNASAVVGLDDAVTVSVRDGAELRLVYVPGPAFDPESDPQACEDAVGRVVVDSHDVARSEG